MLPYFVSTWERTILKQNEALILAATPNMSHLEQFIQWLNILRKGVLMNIVM